MSWIQKLFKAIFPTSWGESMEADSRKWMLKCNCGFEQSFWNLGGIRWKASGNQRNYMKCVSCGERSWHRTYKKET
jgi:hypothetical protein